MKAPHPPVEVLDTCFRDAPAGFYLCEAGGGFAAFYVSPNVEAILGYSPRDILADPLFWQAHVHPEDLEQAEAELAGVLDAGRRAAEYRFRNAQGNYLWIRDEISAVHGEDGRISHLQGYWFDISERKEQELAAASAHRELAEQKAFLRQVLDNIPQQVYWKDREGVFRGCNEAGARAVGLASTDAIVGLSDCDLYDDPEEGRYFFNLDLKAIEEGKPQWHRYAQKQQADGRVVCLDISKVPLRDRAGEINGLLISYEDITDFALVETGLKKFKQAVEQSSSIIVVTDGNGVIEYVNPQFCRTYGYTPNEVLGRHTRLLKSGLMPAEEYERLWQTITAGESWRGEFSNLRKDGSITEQAATISPIFDDGGGITHYVAIEESLDRIRSMEKSLAAEARFSRALMDAIPIAMFYKDASGIFLGCNRAFEEHSGVSRENLVGKTSFDLFPPEYARAFFEADQALFANPGSQVVESLALRGDGSVSEIRAYNATYCDEEGRVAGMISSVFDITDEKRLERALRQSEEKFRHLVEDTNVVLYEAAPATLMFTYVSPRVETLFGYSASAWLEEGFWAAHLHPDDRSGAVKLCLDATRRGQDHVLEYRLQTAGGESVWLEDRVRVVRDESGRVVLLSGIMIDITDRKQSELALAESEERFRIIANYTVNWENWVAADGRLLWVNPAVERIAGYTQEECYAMAGYPLPLVHPDDRERTAREFGRAFAEGTSGEQEEYRILRKDRTVIHCSVSWRGVRDADGHLIGVRASLQDITAQTLARDELFRARQMLQLVLDHIPQRVFWKDHHLAYLGANKAFLADYGLDSMDGLVGRDDFDLNPPELARRFRQDDQELIESDRPKLDYEEMIEPAPGKQVWARAGKVPMHDHNGRVIGILGMYEDVTDRRRMEQRLSETLRQLQTLLDNAPVGVAYLENRHLVWFNHAMETMFGYTLEELQGQLTECLYPSSQDYEKLGKAAYPLLVRGEPFETERLMRHRSGRLFWCHLRGAVPDPQHPDKGSIWILMDVDRIKTTEHKLREFNATLAQRVAEETEKGVQRERLLIQQSRQAAMGEMIGNIAHQWRQPLSVLGLIVQNIGLDFDDGVLSPDKLEEYIAKAMRSIQQMSTTIDDFRDFFRPDQRRERFRLLDAVNECLHLVDAGIRNNQIAIHSDVSPQICMWGHRNVLAQVLLNLISNAKDVLVERRVADARIDIEAHADPVMATIKVRDNGGGVPEELLEKVFDPYFTTKAHGTGIGLYMSKTIVEQHMRGSIHLANTGAGAEFVLVLPLRGLEEDKGAASPGRDSQALSGMDDSWPESGGEEA